MAAKSPFYLGYLDHFVKESLHGKAYVRYMDDLVLWHDDRLFLRQARKEIAGYVETELGLELKPPHLSRTSRGWISLVIASTRMALA